MTIEYKISEIEKVAQEVIAKTKSKIILFYGSMGAGKTTLIKHIVKELGATDAASSPTFSLVNEYESPNGPIFHFDFYRIKDEMEALDMGFEDYVAQNTWIFIEWPEKIVNFLPENNQKLQISREKENVRMLKFC